MRASGRTHSAITLFVLAPGSAAQEITQKLVAALAVLFGPARIMAVTSGHGYAVFFAPS